MLEIKVLSSTYNKIHISFRDPNNVWYYVQTTDWNIIQDIRRTLKDVGISMYRREIEWVKQNELILDFEGKHDKLLLALIVL